jgi:hypothetical protein
MPLECLPRRCPVCHDDTIIGHGRRRRQCHDDQHDCIWVRRGLCEPCRKTFTILPDWLAPAGHYSLHCRQQSCERIAAGDSAEQAAPHCKDSTRLPDRSSVPYRVCGQPRLRRQRCLLISASTAISKSQADRRRNGSKLRVGLIAAQYFETVGIPLLQGRLLTEAEIGHNAHLAVINEELRKRYFLPGSGPLGARIHVPGLKINGAEILTPPEGDQWFEVVGVAATARNRGLQDPAEPAIYIPYNMATVPGATFLLKTDVEPLSIVRSARERVRSVDAELPVTEIRTLEEYLSRFERAYPRFSTTLFTVFAAVGLLLAATGLYSVVSFTVAQRTHEFGIRMALGAQRRHVLQLVAGSTTALIAIGTGAGLAGSMALSQVITRFVEGWNPHDPVAYIAVAAVLALTGLLACWFPAGHATSIDPMAALRHD